MGPCPGSSLLQDEENLEGLWVLSSYGLPLPASAKGRKQGDGVSRGISDTEEERKGPEHLPVEQGEQGSAYLQCWSALSNNGVSFSRNSKAQLTSSLKSCKESETSTWFLGPPLLPQSAMQAHEDTLLDTRACKQVVPTTGSQRLDGEKHEASPARPSWPQ